MKELECSRTTLQHVNTLPDRQTVNWVRPRWPGQNVTQMTRPGFNAAVYFTLLTTHMYCTVCLISVVSIMPPLYGGYKNFKIAWSAGNKWYSAAKQHLIWLPETRRTRSFTFKTSLVICDCGFQLNYIHNHNSLLKAGQLTQGIKISNLIYTHTLHMWLSLGNPVQVLRNASFIHLFIYLGFIAQVLKVCRTPSPLIIVVCQCLRLSFPVLWQFLTFQAIHCASSQQPSFR